MKRVGIYARVSSSDQNPALQLNELKEYCQRRDLQFIEFVDHGVSGAKDSRPQFDALLKNARSRNIDMVLVWKFDRFARSTTNLINSLNEFNALGVDFVSLTECIDTGTAMGRFIFTVFAALGEFERNLICQRVRAGIKAARERGTRFGRKAVSVNRERIAHLRIEGKSVRFIAKDQNCSIGVIHAIIHGKR